MTVALEIKGLHAWYGESHILHDMNLSVAKGEVVTLLGRNGAGRTTTLRAIMGLTGRRSGSIKINGVETISLPTHRIAHFGVGYCPEERAIFSSLSAEENLMLPPTLTAGGMSVAEIFARYGEAEFRALEARVMRRLLEGPRIVLATGGGAILNPDTRAHMAQCATSVWMRADLDVVVSRVQRRDTRPLLRGRDPAEALRTLAEVRYPLYSLADVTVDLGLGAHTEAVETIIRSLRAFWKTQDAGDQP